MIYRTKVKADRASGGKAEQQPGKQGRLLARYMERVGLTRPAAVAREAQLAPGAMDRLQEMLRCTDPLPVSPDLEESMALLYLLFGSSRDLTSRKLSLGPQATRAMLVYLDTAVDRMLLQSVIDGLLLYASNAPAGATGNRLQEYLALQSTTAPDVQREDRIAPVLRAITLGEAILWVEGATVCLRLTVSGGQQRAVSEPETEPVIRGPREGFVESYHSNLSLIRRRIRDPRLRVESLTLGEISHTPVSIIYVHGLCKQSLVDEVRRRIDRIKIDGLLDSGQVHELIEDTPWTLFPLLKSSERPDVACSALLEGRVIILVDGSPFAMIAPTVLADMLQAAEDYYERFPIALFLRMLRWLFAFLAIYGPALYVALTTFHQEMIPTNLLLSIVSAREGVPFPAVLEALMMEVAFEALREAGVRLPKPVGQAVSIVGALILGEAAVQAGIVSAPMVIVMASTGIASFIIPKFSAAIAFRLLRFPMLLLAGTFGAYGITLGSMVVIIHLLSLRSFGTPYLAPLGPLLVADQQDTILRSPTWAMRTRPAAIESLDPVRAGRGMKPHPPTDGEERS